MKCQVYNQVKSAIEDFSLILTSLYFRSVLFKSIKILGIEGIKRLKKLTLGVIAVLMMFFIIVVLLPAPISPAAYSPPKPQEISGVLAANNLLQKAELLALGEINGPEEVALDSQGRVYSGTQDGKIMMLTPDGKLNLFAETFGRPLGMQFDKNQNLIVCDADKGVGYTAPLSLFKNPNVQIA